MNGITVRDWVKVRSWVRVAMVRDDLTRSSLYALTLLAKHYAKQALQYFVSAQLLLWHQHDHEIMMSHLRCTVHIHRRF